MSSIISQVKNYWNSRPCNLKHSNKDKNSIEYYDEVMTKKFKVEPHIPSFCEFNKYKGKKILEIGSGLGTMAVNYALCGADITCVELSDKSLELCKQNFKVRNLKGTFYCGNAEELLNFLPSDVKYDMIFSFGVIHHSPHPDIIIQNMKKVLKPGGQLKLMVYNKFSFKLFAIYKELNIWDFNDVNFQIAKRSEAEINCPITFTYTPNQASKLLGSDFKISSIRKDHIFKYNIPHYINKKFVIDDAFKNMSNEEFKEMERELGWHLLIDAIYHPIF